MFRALFLKMSANAVEQIQQCTSFPCLRGVLTKISGEHALYGSVSGGFFCILRAVAAVRGALSRRPDSENDALDYGPPVTCATLAFLEKASKRAQADVELQTAMELGRLSIVKGRWQKHIWGSPKIFELADHKVTCKELIEEVRPYLKPL